jgi:hypothetical protein
MNEVRKSDKTGAISDLAAPFAQASWDATRNYCEQGQSIAKSMTEWNTEVSHFLSHRIDRNGEAIGRMTKCQGLPEIFAIQTGWVHDAADDYFKEMTKLMEVSSRIMVGMLGSVGQAETPSPSTNVRMRTGR